MMNRKNKLMNAVSLAIIGITAIVHLLARRFHVFDQNMHAQEMLTSAQMESQFGAILNVLLVLPALLLAVTLIIYSRRQDHPSIPYMHTLVLTLGSISIIAGAGGHVEFHFSIFMVIAALSYYKNIKLIACMTGIFAAQHILGFLLIPELVFGSTSYSLTMLIIHAVFLIFTSAATSLQIHSTLRIEASLREAQQQQRAAMMNDITSKLADSTRQLKETAEQLAGQSRESTGLSQHLGRIIEDIAHGTKEQMAAMEQNRAIIHEIGGSIRQAAASASEAAGASEESARQAEFGSHIIGNILSEIKNTGHSVDRSRNTLMVLSRHVSRIGDILEVVRGIASQTHLLALNASIESARAGEAGRGFAVVAGEVRKLAEQSSASVGEITELIDSIHRETADLLGSIGQVHDNLSSGVQVVDQARASFDVIHHAVKQSADQMKEISAATQQLSTGSDRMNHSIQEMTRFTNDTAAHAQDIVKAFQEHAASIRQVSDAADFMAALVTDLNSIMDQLAKEARE